MCECVRGVEGRGEAYATGLPREEAGVGEQSHPLSSTAGEPRPKDATGSVDQAGTAGTWDTRGISVPLWSKAFARALTQDVLD